MERHCTAHLKRGVALGREILNCLKGKGCSGRQDRAQWQIKPCCITHAIPPRLPRDPAPSVWIHRQKAVTSSQKKQPRQIFTANAWRDIVFFPSTLKISYRTSPALFIFFLITNSLRALSRWCSCLMYFIFPRTACSQCEECQLFWET